MVILGAPIQEYTTAAFRNAHAQVIGGIDEYVAPFVRLEAGVIPRRSQVDLSRENDRNGKTSPQVLAKNREEMETLLGYLSDCGYDRVDVNLGCPFPKVTAHGYGAGMLQNPQAVGEVLQSAVERGFRVSVKMRLGMASADEACSLLPILNDAPLVRIVLHPRTASQQYSGDADREAFGRFASQSRCPVVWNGDVRSWNDAAGRDEVMIGRGLLENPLLSQNLRGKTLEKEALVEFHRALMGECEALYQQPLLALKLFWEYLLPGASKKDRKGVLKARTLEEYRDAAAMAFENIV